MRPIILGCCFIFLFFACSKDNNSDSAANFTENAYKNVKGLITDMAAAIEKCEAGEFRDFRKDKEGHSDVSDVSHFLANVNKNTYYVKLKKRANENKVWNANAVIDFPHYEEVSKEVVKDNVERFIEGVKNALGAPAGEFSFSGERARVLEWNVSQKDLNLSPKFENAKITLTIAHGSGPNRGTLTLYITY